MPTDQDRWREDRWVARGALAGQSGIHRPRSVVLILYQHPLSKSRHYRIPVTKLSPSLAIALSVALPEVFT